MADSPRIVAKVERVALSCNHMYYIYVLRSKRNSKNYVGFTSKTPQERLGEHNSGTNVFTRQNRPFELIYSESYEDENFARKRERFLKSGNGRAFLKSKLDIL